MYIFRSIIRKFMYLKCLEMITLIASKNKKYMLACAGPESIVIHSNFFSIHIFRSMIRKRMSSKQCLEMITLITSKIKNICQHMQVQKLMDQPYLSKLQFKTPSTKISGLSTNAILIRLDLYIQDPLDRIKVAILKRNM